MTIFEILFVCIALVLTIFGALWFSMQVTHSPRDYLCPIAEFSPDVTQWERERCRKLRAMK